MTGLWLRVRVWIANRLLDLGFPPRVAAAIVPIDPEDRLKGRRE